MDGKEIPGYYFLKNHHKKGWIDWLSRKIVPFFTSKKNIRKCSVNLIFSQSFLIWRLEALFNIIRKLNLSKQSKTKNTSGCRSLMICFLSFLYLTWYYFAIQISCKVRKQQLGLLIFTSWKVWFPFKFFFHCFFGISFEPNRFLYLFPLASIQPTYLKSKK